MVAIRFDCALYTATIGPARDGGVTAISHSGSMLACKPCGNYESHGTHSQLSSATARRKAEAASRSRKNDDPSRQAYKIQVKHLLVTHSHPLLCKATLFSSSLPQPVPKSQGTAVLFRFGGCRAGLGQSFCSLGGIPWLVFVSEEARVDQSVLLLGGGVSWLVLVLEETSVDNRCGFGVLWGRRSESSAHE